MSKNNKAPSNQRRVFIHIISRWGPLELEVRLDQEGSSSGRTVGKKIKNKKTFSPTSDCSKHSTPDQLLRCSCPGLTHVKDFFVARFNRSADPHEQPSSLGPDKSSNYLYLEPRGITAFPLFIRLNNEGVALFLYLKTQKNAAR